MGEAVEAFNDMKWSNWEEKFMPYKDPTGVLKDTPRPSKKKLKLLKIFALIFMKHMEDFPLFFRCNVLQNDGAKSSY